MATQTTTPTIGSTAMKDGLANAKNIANDVKADAKDVATKAYSQAKDSAQDLADDAGPQIMQRLHDVSETIQDGFAQVRKNSRTYVTQSESFIKKYPFATVAGAVVVGALFAGILRRSKE